MGRIRKGAARKAALPKVDQKTRGATAHLPSSSFANCEKRAKFAPPEITALCRR